MNMFNRLVKAAVAVTLSPVAVVADVVRLPSTAFDGKPAFGLTESMLNAAGENVAKAVGEIGEEE